MKKISYILIGLLIMIVIASCGRDAKTSSDNTYNTGVASQSSQTGSPSAEPSASSTSTSVISATSSTNESTGSNDLGDAELIQSASIDLDADGINEQVEAYQKTVKSQAAGGTDELEGILRISGSGGTRDIIFARKQAGLTGVMSSFEFKDLNGDGVKEVFIIIPEVGAGFSLNYFYVYDYKTGRSYSYNSDSNLVDFTGGIKFIYKGSGKLQMIHDKPPFTATFNIADGSNAPKPDDEANADYENSWVDPTPVEISVNGIHSTIDLVNTTGGITEIKVPLPVFGLATSDMIGEVDLYYAVDSKFEPVLKRFTVMDFKDSEAIKIGECRID